MLQTRREVSKGRFRSLMLKWLASLPAAGWEETSHELGQALAAFAERRKLVADVPLCPGGKVAGLYGFLSENGFPLAHHRSEHARTLRFTRSPVHRWNMSVKRQVDVALLEVR
jgi:hypothetical protein